MIWFFLAIISIFMILAYLMRRINSQLKSEIEYLNQDSKEILEECEELRKRCNEVEDAMEKGYGIKVRTEVAQKVETEFSKLEMVIIITGVQKLLKGTENPQDAEIYINLFKKINALLENMEDEG